MAVGVVLALLIMLKSKDSFSINNSPTIKKGFSIEQASIPELYNLFQTTESVYNQVYSKIQGLKN